MVNNISDSAPLNLAELNERASRPTEHVVSALTNIDSDILVLGAGGKMGFHLCLMIQRALQELGSQFRVQAVSRFRSPGATDPFVEHSIETVPVDLTEIRTIESLPESRNIFYLAGVKFGASDDPDRLRQMNVDLPARIAQRYAKLDARIVALSTGCVYSFTTPQSGGSVETDDLNPPGDYAVSCLGREQAFRESGAKTSLVRLNYSVDLRYGVLVDIAQNVLAEYPIDLTTPFVNVIWQGDANAYIIQALEHAARPPFVINVTGEKILKVRQIASRFGEFFHKPVTFTGTENPTAWLNNADESHRTWGKPNVNEDELIQWVAEWLAQGGETLNKPTQFQVRDGKY